MPGCWEQPPECQRLIECLDVTLPGQDLTMFEADGSCWCGSTSDEANDCYQICLDQLDAAVSQNPTVPECHGRFCPLEDLATETGNAGLKALTRAKSLRSITLSSETLTDEGIAYLLGLPHLDLFRLNDGTGVTDRSLESLGQIRTLKHLQLNETQITDAGLEHIAKFAAGALPGVGPGGGEQAGLPGVGLLGAHRDLGRAAPEPPLRRAVFEVAGEHDLAGLGLPELRQAVALYSSACMKRNRYCL